MGFFDFGFKIWRLLIFDKLKKLNCLIILIAFYDLDFEFVLFYDYICSVLNVGFFSWDFLLVDFSIFECFNC